MYVEAETVTGLDQIALDERLYVQQDANWNVTAVVSTSGSVLEREVYDPYGAATFLSASWSTLSGSTYAWIYLYQGGRFEIVSGLYQFRNREFSTALGRWMQTDPVGARRMIPTGHNALAAEAGDGRLQLKLTMPRNVTIAGGRAGNLKSTLSITNGGRGDAKNVLVTLEGPAAAAYDSATPGPASVDETSDGKVRLTWIFPNGGCFANFPPTIATYSPTLCPITASGSTL